MATLAAPEREPTPGWGVLACAWAASIALLFAPLPGDARALSRLALAALPFVVLAGVPGRREATSSGERTVGGALLWSAAALGPLAVGARLDALDGRAVAELALVLAGVSAIVALLAYATRAARGASAHALLWMVLVLLPALVGALLALFVAPAAAERAHAEWSPLGWIWGCALDPAAAVRAGALLPPFGVALALAGAGRFLRGAAA